MRLYANAAVCVSVCHPSVSCKAKGPRQALAPGAGHRAASLLFKSFALSKCFTFKFHYLAGTLDNPGSMRTAEDGKDSMSMFTSSKLLC